MEIILLCISAIIIANYARKRSSVVAIGHSILFFFLLVLSLFKTDVTFIQEAVRNFCGDDIYQIIRTAMSSSYVWFLSTNVVLGVVELLFMVIAAIIAAIFVVDAILSGKKPFEQSPSPEEINFHTAVAYLATGKNLFLKYCKLLN